MWGLEEIIYVNLNMKWVELRAKYSFVTGYI